MLQNIKNTYRRFKLPALILGSAGAASVASAQSAPLDTLTGAVDTTTEIGVTVAGVSVTLFLIAMAMRFFRKGAR